MPDEGPGGLMTGAESAASDPGPPGDDVYAVPTISVLIVNYGTRRALIEGLTSLRPDDHEDIEVIVVDHDDLSEDVPSRLGVTWITQSNRGYAAGVNRAAQRAVGEFVLLLNPDAVITPEDMRLLAAVLRDHRDVGAVAPMHEHPNGRPQHPFHGFPSLAALVGHATSLRRTILGQWMSRSWLAPALTTDESGLVDVPQPPASCLMLRRDVVAPDLMATDLPLFFNDVDLCARVAANGARVVVVPWATVVHEPGTSTVLLGEAVRLGEWCVSAYRYLRRHVGKGRAEIFRFLLSIDLALRWVAGRRHVSRAIRQLWTDTSGFDRVEAL